MNFPLSLSSSGASETSTNKIIKKKRERFIRDIKIKQQSVVNQTTARKNERFLKRIKKQRLSQEALCRLDGNATEDGTRFPHCRIKKKNTKLRTKSVLNDRKS